MSDIQLVLFASILVSVSVMCGFACSWVLSGKLYGKKYNYLIFYALYLLLANIPMLVATMLGIASHSALDTILDITGLLLLFLAAEKWGGGGYRTWHWAIVLAGAMLSIAHSVTGERAFAAGYAACVSVVMLITLYNIARNSPNLVTLFVAVSFAGWTALNFTFPHSGNIVGHAFGMSTKVIVFGALTVAHYERQHRRAWRAARVRKAAIDIMTEDAEAIERVVHVRTDRHNGTWRPAAVN